jgi:hypothetical protein
MNVKCFTIFSSIEKDKKWFPFGNGHVNFKTKIHCEGCKLKVCVNFDNMCTKLIFADDVLNSIKLFLEKQ